MEGSRRKQFQMEDDYEKALAKALELSRMDHQQSQRASANPPDQSGQPSSSTQRPPINLENTGREGREYVRNQEDDPKVTGEDLKQQDACRGGLAIPLCLPNNYKWNRHTGECIKIGEERSSLYVIEEALNQLNTIKGPVCVVSVSGPLRKGKSFVLSEAFDQPNVFRLGHTLNAETVGIWIWIVPEIHKDCHGQDVTVVLLDSEGTGDTSSEYRCDRQISTLSVLLASLLIYNSSGVPEKKDKEQLEYPLEFCLE